MDAEFWHEKWKNSELGFHQAQVHELLAQHWPQFNLAKGSRVFVPLCGKTNDIGWFLAQGYRVAGIELSQLAVEALFELLELEYTINELDDLLHFQAENIDIYVGNIFCLTSSVLGDVDAIYDRAALVALPSLMRSTYAEHLVALSQNAPQFLICFDYDQSQLSGPPFSTPEHEIQSHYASAYQLNLIDKVEVEGGLKSSCKADEVVWFLT